VDNKRYQRHSFIGVAFFYKHKVSMALQRAQATYISNRVVIVREGSSRLGVLTSLPPLFWINMLHGTSGGFST